QLNRYWSVNATVRVENVGVNNVPVWDPPAYQMVEGNNFVLGLGAGVTYDTTDSIFRATEGYKFNASFEQVTGDFNFPVVSLEFDKYFPLYQRPDGSGRQVLAFRGQAALAGSQAPVFERFFEGGFRSMRGFAFRGISPLVNGIPVGGDFMLFNSLEYQLPV